MNRIALPGDPILLKEYTAMKIGLMSDTHSFIDLRLLDLFEDRDEIWHAGDFGSTDVIQRIERKRPLKGVYGNIDSPEIQSMFPNELKWQLGDFKIFMTHIAGYPGKYTARVKKQLKEDPVDLFICGHSHILKIMKDPLLGHLHINPGACGHEGFHIFRTAVRFEIIENKLINLEVIELGERGKMGPS
ncbi:MAG: metallophosphoesterase family protein [Saprospiraceae bacterium]